MINSKLFLPAAMLLAACSAEPTLQLTITNPTDVERDNETIEVKWEQIVEALPAATPTTIVVTDAEGDELPSQVLYKGNADPQSLIFQVESDEHETALYTIAVGEPQPYVQQAFGRQVPERYDDYAWENNLCAYRLYGPALETSPEKLITPGIDVWVKCSEKLVIDEWYAKGDYHHNYGDGMDCYKVGRTLGGGASVPMVDGAFYPMEHNYATARTLDNGPIRTTVELTYAPWKVGEQSVSLVKKISLDANQRFNRMDNIYEGDFESLPIAAGFVRHDVKQTLTGEGWLAMVEAVSDSKQPEVDGDIYQAIVLPKATIEADLLGHALAVIPVKSGELMTYYSASGWSLGGIEDMEEWKEVITEQQAMVLCPLEVKIEVK